jgi:endonuclease/exonuclease/phosphatase (EEP) superfamily protein YafD
VPQLPRVLTLLVLAALLLPALLLTALRLLQPEAGWAVRSVSFAPFAVPLYVVAGVLLLVAVVRAARARRGIGGVVVPMVALDVVLVLLVLHVSWLLPAFTGDAPTGAQSSPRLRVMTFNVLHGGATADDVAAAVAAANADVVVLQEVTTPVWRDLGPVRETHPHVAGLSEGRPPDTVVLARRPLGTSRALETVGDSLLVPVSLGARTVGLLAVHPRYPEYPMAWRQDHAALAAAAHDARPALVVGDFNATYDHAVMRRYRDMGYRSAAELLNTGWQPTWPNNGHREVLGLPMPRVVHIDHVMVARSMTALTVEHVDVPGSDHLAVVAEVALR